MLIRPNGLTISVIVISIAAISLIVIILSISSQVLAEIQQKIGNSQLNKTILTENQTITR
jgi:hypothetical protein